jgi:hypothetical protein
MVRVISSRPRVIAFVSSSSRSAGTSFSTSPLALAAHAHYLVGRRGFL